MRTIEQRLDVIEKHLKIKVDAPIPTEIFIKKDIPPFLSDVLNTEQGKKTIQVISSLLNISAEVVLDTLIAGAREAYPNAKHFKVYFALDIVIKILDDKLDSDFFIILKP